MPKLKEQFTKEEKEFLAKAAKKAFLFISNLNCHTKGDKSNILANYIYDKLTARIMGFVVWLNQKGRVTKICHMSTDDCNDFSSGVEGITVYQRMFFFGTRMHTSGIFELIYNGEEEALCLKNRQIISLSTPSLTSIYSAIYFVAPFHLLRYDITQNKIVRYYDSNISMIHPCMFTRSARYIYAVMGYTYNNLSEVKPKFGVFDIKGTQEWDIHILNTNFVFGKCKCIQPSNDEIIVVGGKESTTYKIEFPGACDDMRISEHKKLPFNDNLDSTMSTVYWAGTYYLMSSAGILYAYSKSTKTLKWKKYWLEEKAGIEPVCYGG